MIDLTKYYTADKALADTDKAIEKRAEDTFYSNLKTYAAEFSSVMDKIKSRADKGLTYAEFTPLDRENYDEYINGDSVPTDEERTFSVGHTVVFNILQTLGYRVEKKGQPIYRANANPFTDNPIATIELYLVSWDKK